MELFWKVICITGKTSIDLSQSLSSHNLIHVPASIVAGCAVVPSRRLWMLIAAATARASLEFFDFENLFGFWRTLHLRVVYLIQTSFVAHNLLHLRLRNESSVISVSIFGQIFPAVIPNMILIHPLFLFLPVAHYFMFSFFKRHRRSGKWVSAHTAIRYFTSFTRVYGRITLCMWRHRSVSWHRQFPFFHHLFWEVTLHRLIIFRRSINWDVAQNRRSRSPFFSKYGWLDFICFGIQTTQRIE